jgi:hypothetical protein
MRPALPLVAAISLSTSLALATAACSGSDDSPPYDAARCAVAEPNDRPEEAAALVPGAAPLAAAICYPDLDFYTFTAPTGPAIIRIDLRYQQNGPQGNLDLRLYDRAGALLASSLGTDDDELIVCPDPGAGPSCPNLPAGDYVLEVRELVTGTTGNGYELSVQAR